MQPVEGGAVLGEQDHPFAVPLAIGLQSFVDPGEQGIGFGIRAVHRLLRPVEQVVEQQALFGTQRTHPAAGFFDRLPLSALDFGIVGVVFFSTLDGLEQDALRQVVALLAVAAAVQSGLVLR
ncbi:hypothetical protein D9M70_567860 [compost metagenome]